MFMRVREVELSFGRAKTLHTIELVLLQYLWRKETLKRKISHRQSRGRCSRGQSLSELKREGTSLEQGGNALYDRVIIR